MATLPAIAPPGAGACFLEWQPYTKDRTMGLNHQMASLSCAIAEAFYLGRTLVLNDRICLFGLHQSRWPGGNGELGAEGERCVPMRDIFDVELLSRLVPIHLRRAGNFSGSGWARRSFPGEGAIAHVPAKGWPSSKVRGAYPCAGPAKLVRRHVDSFWFSQCTRRNTDSAEVSAALNTLVGAAESAPKPLNILLRSGLFFAPQIKAAAAAIRARIGGSYVSGALR